MHDNPVCLRVAERTDTVLLSFSRGKDAIGAWIELRRYFKRVIPYYAYLVPGLMSFERQSLAYYQDFFKTEIICVPHPQVYRWINGGLFQPPDRMQLTEAAGLPLYSWQDIEAEIRKDAGRGAEALTATGMRGADSLNRRMALRKTGGISLNTGKFFPVGEWNLDRLMEEIGSAGVKLPYDYKIFSRSFDGLYYEFIAGLKEHLPADFELLKCWYPWCELEVLRYGLK